MPYNFVADCSFHIKKLCSRLSLSEVHAILHEKTAVLRLWTFSPMGAWVTYDDHLWKVRSELSSVNLSSFARCYTAKALRANIGSKSAILLHRGPVDPKFQVEEVAPTNYSCSQKIKLNDLSYGIKIWTDLSSICHNPRVWQTDRQTDVQTLQTEFSLCYIDRVCIPCSAATASAFHMQRGKNDVRPT